MVKIGRIIEELQDKIAALEARNGELEARIVELEHPAEIAPAASPATPPVPAAAPAQATAASSETISEELMLVIAAAVAAYLGERAHIKVVRLVSSHNWAQQGRVSIQASHRLQ
jgi:methylmalonyl-CoA carboxyltransferase large subunit